MSELGKRLKEERERRNINLEELQQITKIQKRYLIGIEEGNYSVMPGKFYVRAFIKQYAEAVGLLPDEILEEYKAEIPTTVHEELPEQLSRVRSRKQISTKGSKFLDMIPMLILVLFIIGGLVALWWFLQNRDVAEQPNTNIENEQAEYQESEEEPPASPEDEEQKGGAEEEQEQTESESTEPETPVEEEAPVHELALKETSGINSTYELTNTDQFEVQVGAITGGETWVEVKNQKGNKFFSGMMSDGQIEQFDFSKESQLIFIVGRSTETTVTINGEEFTFPLDPNEAVRQNITILFTPTVTE